MRVVNDIHTTVLIQIIFYLTFGEFISIQVKFNKRVTKLIHPHILLLYLKVVYIS